MKDNGIYNYMDCSTRHITVEDNKFLLLCHSFFVTIPHNYGCWISIFHDGDYFEENIEKLSESLKAIFRKAISNKCNLINLDTDGFIHSDLVSYNW